MAVWSIVETENLGEDFMLAAEQYHPAKLAIVNYLASLPGRTVGELFEEVQDIVKPGSVYHAARLYDLTDALGNLLRPGTDIDESDFLSNRKRAQAGDIIVSRLRSYLREIAVVPSVDHDVLVSPEFIVLRLRQSSLLRSGAWLLPYLLSQPVQTVLQGSQTGSAHPRFNTDSLLGIRIPEAVLAIADELGEAVDAAHKGATSANELYAEAEALLLRELRLGSVAVPTAKTYTAPFAEVMAAERMDAEYYQPRYYALLALLQKTGAAGRLGNYLRSPVKRGVQPSYETGGELPVIKSQHIGKRSIVLDDPDSRAAYEFGQVAKNRRALVGYGDVLLNSTGVSTIGRCQPLLQNVQALVDGHVAILRCGAALDPVYLSAFLNSPAGYMQTERAWTGSSGQIELRPELVEEYTIWLAPMALQLTIRDMIETAHQLRESATGYLTAAQRKVEEFIQSS